MALASKTKYFIGAAVLFFFVSVMCLGRVGLERIGYARNSDVRAQTDRIVSQARNRVSQAEDNVAQEEQLQTTAQEKLSLFKYREVIPEIYNLVRSSLPNAENNPDQRELYEAYARGDVDTVMNIDRKDRKQIFLAFSRIYYSPNIDDAEFGETTYARKQALVEHAKEDEEERGGGERSRERDLRSLMSLGRGMDEEAEKKDPGFVVTVLGYSPYEDFLSLLHPTNVSDDPEKWGVVTRLRHLGDPEDANCPLVLLSATEGPDLRIRPGIVDLGDPEMPAGIGSTVTVSAEEAAALTGGLVGQFEVGDVQMLVDPVTKEYISAVAQVDDNGVPKTDMLGRPLMDERDHWFELNFKLRWHAGPKEEETL